MTSKLPEMIGVSYDSTIIIAGTEQEIRFYQEQIFPMHTIWLFTPTSDEYWKLLREYWKRSNFKL